MLDFFLKIVSYYAVGWFTLALVNAGLAQGKNRSGFYWFLWSVVLGPVATLALVVFFEKLKPREPDKPDAHPWRPRINPDDFAPEGSEVPSEGDESEDRKPEQ